MRDVLAAWVLLACASCGRPSPHSTPPLALPPGEVESLFARDAAPPAIATIPSGALDLGGSRIGGTFTDANAERGAVPILYERGEVTPAFARAAPPSKAHPRGTIAVEVKFFDGPGSTHGHHDAALLEVDLDTGANLRTVDLGKDWTGSFLFDGAHGPIAILWHGPIIEVLWFDRALVQEAQRSLAGVFNDPLAHDSYMVKREPVGDRVAFAFADGETRTNVWLIDSSGTVIEQTCPTPWRADADILENGDDVVVGPIGGYGGSLFVCAVRADGTGKVRLQPYYENERIVRDGRKAYFSINYDDDAGVLLPAGLYPVGRDLLPVLPAVKLTKPAEVIAASKQGFQDPATLVNGTVVLVRSPCCGNGGPYVWLWDPRSGADGGAP